MDVGTMSHDIVWRIYNRTEKGQRGPILIGTVNASSKEDAEAKANSRQWRAKYVADYVGEIFAHV